MIEQITFLMKNFYLLCLFLLAFSASLSAQMIINGNTLYGNEWIHYDQSYYKIPITQDGMYRIYYDTLQKAGFPLNGVDASQLQVYHLGEEIPIYVSQEGALAPGFYLEFYGKKNRGELDRFLYKGGEADMLNPEYSMFTDTAAYYLTIAPQGASSKRFVTVETDLSNLPTKEEWYWEEAASVQPLGGFIENQNGDASESIFEPGEGNGASKGKNSVFQIFLPINNRYTGPGAPDSVRIQVGVGGIGPISHYIQLSINNNIIGRIGNGLNKMWHESIAYTPTAAENNFNIQLVDTSGTISIGYIKLFYPRIFNFLNRNQFVFKLTGNNASKYLEIESFLHRNTAPILYDLTAGTRIITKLSSNNKVQIKLAAFTGEHEFVLMNPNEGFSPRVTVQRIEFPSLPDDASYIIITSRKLQGETVGDYADYRTSAAGGNHQVAVVNVEDLYEQFSYGVQRHPLAIRNFGHYIHENWKGAKFVLILGKGREFKDIRSNNQYTAAEPRFFVPTFGTPGSDNLLLASNDTQVPVLPIGRIAATTPAEIEMYLEKLKTYENPISNDRSWRKDVVHLGGGKIISEQNQIEYYMNRMRDIIQNNSFGANLTTYYKQSTDPTQRVESDQINQLIQQQGVGLITFFGHGGYTLIDLSIGDAKNYTNSGKYPIMFALGCLAGDIFIPDVSYSENFVLQRDKGGIAFVGTSSEGFIPDLGQYQQTVYRNLADTMYGKSLGEILQSSISAEDANGSKTRRMLLQQFVLHGDPALILNPYNAPDYIIEKGTLQVSPSPVSIQDKSLDLKFNILNIAKNTQDTLSIKVSRKLPNGIEKSQTKKIKAPAYRTDNPVVFTFPVADSSSSTAGFNDFTVVLDPDNTITELPEPNAEVNNQETRQLFIFDKGLTPIEPLNYAIVNTAPFHLRASTASAYETKQRYLMQIDTSKYFNSPARDDTSFYTTGGVLDWQPNIKTFDNTTYYWRVALESLIEGTYNWTTSSFTYIKDSPLGWRQGHFQQVQEDDLMEMTLPDTTRQLTFAYNPTDVELRDFMYTGGSVDNVTINTITNEYTQGISGGGVRVCVFDGKTGTPWQNPYPGLYGSRIGASWAFWQTTFSYSTRSEASRKNLIHFLNDTIPSGNYVLLFTIQHANSDYEPSKWAADSLTNDGINLFKILEKEGAKKIRETMDSVGPRPYAFFYKKGASTPIFEILTESPRDSIVKSFKVPGFKDEGSVTSRRVGPARKWARLQQQLTPDEYDEYTVQLYGIQADEKTKDLLLENVTAADTTLAWIDSLKYPYLELQLHARDTVNRTPVQLNYWQVLYEGIPEAALNPLALPQVTAWKDTLQEGEPLNLQVAVSNLSAYDMDSLLVNYKIFNENGNAVRDSFIRLAPLLKQGDLIFPLNIATHKLYGKQQLAIEINPTKDKPEQLELYHFNNIGVLNFYVQGDVRNPLVDVTFDGMRILNGDIISSKPQIVVSVQDENKFLPLLDTTSFQLFLVYPNSDKEIPISFSQVRFEPGQPDAKGSKATIYFSPEFTEDGIYTLEVQGKDASGNLASTKNILYRVQFEVVTENKISNVFNYPNPFSTSTQFVYTLTGAEPPSHYQIQIMTISGRVVRELTELDLGPLRIGTHRTELPWDGTDQYGDRLANGIYLYRVVVKDQDGKDYEKYDTGTNQFFKKNIGKLVILR